MVNTTNKIGKTALILASNIKDSSPNKHLLIETLLNAGANVNAASIAGLTALECAVKTKCLKSVKLLLDAGANMDAMMENKCYGTIEQYVARGNNTEMKALFEAHRAKLSNATARPYRVRNDGSSSSSSAAPVDDAKVEISNTNNQHYKHH